MRLLSSFVNSRHHWGHCCQTILKKKNAKDEKVCLPGVAHWCQYAVGLVVLQFPYEVGLETPLSLRAGNAKLVIILIAGVLSQP